MAKLKEFNINDLPSLLDLLSNDLDILSKYGVYKFADYSVNHVDMNLNPYIINLIYNIKGNQYAGYSSIPYIRIEKDGSEYKSCLDLCGITYEQIYYKVQSFIVEHIFGLIKPIN